MKKTLRKSVLVILTVALFLSGTVLCSFARYDDPNVPDVAEEALARVPDCAYAAEAVTVADALSRYEEYLGYSDCTEIYFRELARRDMVSLHYLYEEPQALQGVFEELYGPGSFELWEFREEFLEDFLNGDYAEDGAYCYQITGNRVSSEDLSESSGGTGIGIRRYVCHNVEGDLLYVYQRVGYYKNDGSSYVIRGGFLFDPEASAELPVLARGQDTENYKKDSGSVYSRFHDGVYEGYLPVYQHTFRENGKGGYYWVSTEITAPGKAIPAGLLEGNADFSAGESGNTDSAGSPVFVGAPEETDAQSSFPIVFPIALAVCAGILTVTVVCAVSFAGKNRK